MLNKANTGGLMPVLVAGGDASRVSPTDARELGVDGFPGSPVCLLREKRATGDSQNEINMCLTCTLPRCVLEPVRRDGK